MNILLFILLLILLILSAILIAFSIKYTNVTIGGDSKGQLSPATATVPITATQLYEDLKNTDKNTAITIFKLNNNKIIMTQDNFSIQDAKISALIYGRGEALIGNIDILLHILLHINDYLQIIIIGNMIAFKFAGDAHTLLTLLNKYLPPPLQEIESKDGVHILTFKQPLEFDPTEISIKSLITKITRKSSISDSIYTLMSIFMGETATNTKETATDTKETATGTKETAMGTKETATDTKETIIKGGAQLYTIALNPQFLSEFEKKIEIAYNSSIYYDNIQEESPSLYNIFMYALIENNRNVELVEEKPHTEKMKKGTIYFLPKVKNRADITVFSKLGIDNFGNIPLGEYYINNSQNVIKIE